jgi:hypothetical protein
MNNNCESVTKTKAEILGESIVLLGGGKYLML